MSPRRFAVIAGAAGAATAVVLTFPLVLHLRSHVLEDGSYDVYQFLWNLWWVRESLLTLHANPFRTTYLFYPDGVPLLFHTFSFTLGVASLPLQAAFGLVAAHNLLVLAAPAATVLAVGLLAREVTGDPWAALVAGLAAALAPAAVWFLPVLYLHCSYLIALLVWAWWLLQRRQRPANVGLALGLLAALVFASQEYAVMALAILVLDTLCRLVVPRMSGLGPAWLAGTLAFWSLAGAGLAALAWIALGAPASPPAPLQMLVGSGYLAGLVTPPWLVPPARAFWAVLYLGTAPLLLGAAGLVCRFPRVRFWALATGLLALMALGPRLHVHYPLTDMHLPDAGFPFTGPPGPYALAHALVPLLHFFRAPYRWIVAAEIGLAVVAALGVARLRARAASPRGRRALTAAILALVLGAGALDARGLRARLVASAVPPPYEALRSDPTPAAVLELPSGLAAGTFAAFSSLYMYYQTFHRKFLLEGTVARLPPGRQRVTERATDDLSALPYVKYVVVHRDLLATAYPPGAEQLERFAPLLDRDGELIRRAGPIEIYRLRSFRPETVRSPEPELAHRLLAVGHAGWRARAGFFARFVLASTVFVLAAALLRRVRPPTRAAGLTLVSLALLAWLATPLVAGLMIAYSLVFFGVVERFPPGRARVAVVVALLALQVIAPIFWLPRLPGYSGSVREFVAFSTNVMLLRFWAYAYDRLRRRQPVPPRLADYGLYMFFFPAFVNGPLLSLDEFQRRRLPAYWTENANGLPRWLAEWRAFLRIALGLVLVAVAMAFVCLPGTTGYEAAASDGPGAAWGNVVRVYLCWYVGFSGWTEAAIGFGLLAGVALPENFNAPLLSYGVADFWRRWNITFGHWLRDYIYVPLGGAYPRDRRGVRRPEWRNTAAVFGFVALYHLVGGLKLLGPGYFPALSYLPWTLWAVGNTVAVLMTRGLARPARIGVLGAGVIALTVAFSCVGHATALFPPGMPLTGLWAIYRRLVPL